MLLQRSVLAFAAVTALTVPVLAQSQGNIRTITRYQIKAGEGPNFQAAVKEYNAVLKKAGSERPYSMWQALTGPNEYVMVRYHAKWADLEVGPSAAEPKLKDVRSELTAIGGRIIRSTESSQRIVDEVLPELSLPRAAEMPKMVRVLRTRVQPARINDYIALIKGELVPAVKKSGLKTYSVTQTRYGAPNGEFRAASGIDGWAKLDGESPIVTAMGREAYQKFVDKLRAMTVESEYMMYRFMPDLSYLPGQPAPTSGSN